MKTFLSFCVVFVSVLVSFGKGPSNIFTDARQPEKVERTLNEVCEQCEKFAPKGADWIADHIAEHCVKIKMDCPDKAKMKLYVQDFIDACQEDSIKKKCSELGVSYFRRRQGGKTEEEQKKVCKKCKSYISKGAEWTAAHVVEYCDKFEMDCPNEARLKSLIQKLIDSCQQYSNKNKCRELGVGYENFRRDGENATPKKICELCKKMIPKGADWIADHIAEHCVTIKMDCPDKAKLKEIVQDFIGKCQEESSKKKCSELDVSYDNFRRGQLNFRPGGGIEERQKQLCEQCKRIIPQGAAWVADHVSQHCNAMGFDCLTKAEIKVVIQKNMDECNKKSFTNNCFRLGVRYFDHRQRQKEQIVEATQKQLCQQCKMTVPKGAAWVADHVSQQCKVMGLDCPSEANLKVRMQKIIDECQEDSYKKKCVDLGVPFVTKKQLCEQCKKIIPHSVDWIADHVDEHCRLLDIGCPSKAEIKVSYQGIIDKCQEDSYKKECRDLGVMYFGRRHRRVNPL